MTNKSDKIEYDFVAATPIRATKRGPVFGESTIVVPEKDLIVIKKNKRSKR